MAHKLNVRVFKWDSAKLSVNIKPGPGDLQISMKFDRAILIRSPTELAVVPCSVLDMLHHSTFETLLTKTIKHLPFLGSFGDVSDLACDMISELFLKFGGKGMLHDSDRALVIFFDVRSNAGDQISCDRQEVRAEEVCRGITAIISTHKADAEMNLEKVEEIEECLKMCPGLTVLERSRGMKEVKSFVEINERSDEEDELDCPICLERIEVADRYPTIKCSHSFHRECLQTWMHERRHSYSCPMCRFEFHVSV